MTPVFQLPSDSDLKATEALYDADQLADPQFVYQEMLILRGAIDGMIRNDQRRREMELQVSDPDAALRWFGPEVANDTDMVEPPVARFRYNAAHARAERAEAALRRLRASDEEQEARVFAGSVEDGVRTAHVEWPLDWPLLVPVQIMVRRLPEVQP